VSVLFLSGVVNVHGCAKRNYRLYICVCQYCFKKYCFLYIKIVLYASYWHFRL
jgi:hypothetical protein